MLLFYGHTLSLFATHWHIISPCYKFLCTLLFANKVHHCPCTFHRSSQSQGISSHITVLFHNFLAQARVVWVLSQCNTTLPLLKSGVVESVIWHSVLIIHRSLPLSLWWNEKRISQKQPDVLKPSVTKILKPSLHVFISNLSCCDRHCNRVKVLPTIALRIHPDLQWATCSYVSHSVSHLGRFYWNKKNMVALPEASYTESASLLKHWCKQYFPTVKLKRIPFSSELSQTKSALDLQWRLFVSFLSLENLLTEVFTEGFLTSIQFFNRLSSKELLSLQRKHSQSPALLSSSQ